MGIKDYGSYQKLQSIQRKLKQKGASLDPDILIKINSEDRLADEWSDDEDLLLRDDTAEIADNKSRRKSVHMKSRKSLRRMDTAKSNKSR